VFCLTPQGSEVAHIFFANVLFATNEGKGEIFISHQYPTPFKKRVPQQRKPLQTLQNNNITKQQDYNTWL
jgi:hypothetical protein